MDREAAETWAVRAVALTAAALHLVLCGIAAFIILFLATFPAENQSPRDAAADDWLIGAAFVIVILAIAIVAAAIARWVRVAAVALVAQLAVGAALLAFTLRESQHSDGTLVLYALASAVTAAAATRAIRVDRR